MVGATGGHVMVPSFEDYLAFKVKDEIAFLEKMIPIW